MSIVRIILASAVAAVPWMRYLFSAPDHAPRTPLVVATDSVSYQITADTVYPGDYRLRLSLKLRNETRDTLWLAYPCYGGPSPQRYFLRANDLQYTHLGHTRMCLASSGAEEPRPTAFAVPPLVTMLDTVDARIFGYRPGNNEIRVESYVGTYRLAYSRWIRRGFLRRSWHIAPHSETMSNEFRVDLAQ